jgi:hypothetical protein
MQLQILSFKMITLLQLSKLVHGVEMFTITSEDSFNSNFQLTWLLFSLA